jgi:hypothetical protein
MLLPEGTFEAEIIAEGIYAFTLPSPLDVSDGDNLTVTWNGEQYVCKVVLMEDDEGVPTPVCGNLGIFEGVEGTGEPFVYTIGDEGGTFVTAENGNITVSVTAETETIHTIDPKFLPSGGGGNATLYFDLLSDDVYIYKTADLSEANRITVSELQEIAESGQSIVLKQTVSAELGGASIFMPVVSVTISPNAVGMCTVIQTDVSDSGVHLIGRTYYTAEYTP